MFAKRDINACHEIFFSEQIKELRWQIINGVNDLSHLLFYHLKVYSCTILSAGYDD